MRAACYLRVYVVYGVVRPPRGVSHVGAGRARPGSHHADPQRSAAHAAAAAATATLHTHTHVPSIHRTSTAAVTEPPYLVYNYLNNKPYSVTIRCAVAE